jgi:hypothetical protein
VIPVNLHELDRLRDGLFLVPQLEDRVAADHLLGLHERTVDHAEPAVGDTHLRAQCARHQRAAIEHVAGLDLALRKLVHGLHEFGGRRHVVGRRDDVHKAHLENSLIRVSRRHRRRCRQPS